MNKICQYEFVYSINTRRRLNSLSKCTIRVLTSFTSLLHAERTSSYSFQIKLQWTLSPITCRLASRVKIISSSFSFVQNKQTRPRLLVLADFVTCLPPEKPRDIVFIPISWISIWRNVSIHHQTKHWEESSQRNIFD